VKPSPAFSRDLKAEVDKGEFEPKYPAESRWLDGGDRYTLLEPSTANPKWSDIVAYDTATGKRTILVPAKQFIPAGEKAPIAIEDYSWSAGNRQLLIFTNSQKVWRRHTRGDYWVLRLSDGKLTKLGGNAPASTLMFAKFSPDGASVAYVRSNNIYVEDLATGNIRQLTSDGSENIINGTTDWVTEEEFDLRDAYRWSPDSKSIAYWQFDQSGVGEFTLINDTKEQYPQLFRYKYPLPGGINSAVRVGVISAAGGDTRWIQLPGDPRNHYIPRLDWVGDSNEIVLQYLNRLQNEDQVYLVDAQTGDTRLLFADKDAAWVDAMDKFDWLADKGSSATPPRKGELLWLSERDGWRHAYLASRTTGQLRLITDFPGDVIDPVFLDEAGGYFYFTASPSDPIRDYLYRTRLDGTGKPEQVTPADQTGENSYDVSPNGMWAIHTWSSSKHPPSFDLIKLSSHQVARPLLNNDGLIAKDNSIDPLPAEFVETPVSDGTKLSTFVVKPPGFDPRQKYPVIVYVYSEPADATVKDWWGYSFFKLIAREGYIVVSFDNEGTPAPRGRTWRKSVYGSIGVLSSKEQAEAIREFARQRPYVDTSRMGIFGSSGGATETLNLMFRYPGLFQAGVAMSPVPDQKLYDTIYQERYMGLPADNAKGYHDGSAINFAEGLTGHLLIIHGSGDDNVHFQGSELLVNRLIELGKPFEFMDYPNRTHSLSEGPGTSYHLYNLVFRFMEEHVPPGPTK
jgi:dipeptidyl-peptidase 4